LRIWIRVLAGARIYFFFCVLLSSTSRIGEERSRDYPPAIDTRHEPGGSIETSRCRVTSVLPTGIRPTASGVKVNFAIVCRWEIFTAEFFIASRETPHPSRGNRANTPENSQFHLGILIAKRSLQIRTSFEGS
jgi:hypothetical protein